MKKNIKLTIVCCLIMCILLSSVAFAAVQESSYLASYHTSISRNGGGKITLDFDVCATHTMQSLGISKIQVRTSTGTLYKTIYSSTTGYSSLLTTNSYIHVGSVNIQLVSGQSYYLVVTFYAKDSSGSGTATHITGTFTA